MDKPRLRKLALIILGIGVIVLLSPLNPGWIQLYQTAESEVFYGGVNLLRLGLIAFVVAGLLAPYESLGWWVGLYREAGSESAMLLPAPALKTIRKFVVYLDGIAISSNDYSPKVTRFLAQLESQLPDDILLIKGIMPYSMTNRPLTSRRPFAKFWRWVVSVKDPKAKGGLGILINLRNMYQVAVSVDSRYGPIYNRGTAQVILNTLLQQGYPLGSGTPVTLIGYSGGGQVALGAVTYLRPALSAPIEVISLAGVISGNTGAIQLEHLYHLVGKLDRVANICPWLFPERWPLLSGSYWNLANSRGKITQISLGPVGHDSENGPLSESMILPDGRCHLQQTLDIMTCILNREDDAPPFVLPGRSTSIDSFSPPQVSSYALYQEAEFNRPDYYPAGQAVNTPFSPVGDWIGRLILPDRGQRPVIQGVLFEVHHAPSEHADLVGKIVPLQWQLTPQVESYLRYVKTDMYFSPQAEISERQGNIHPTRLDYWQQVGPLESIAGAHPFDDIEVVLQSPVEVVEEPVNEPLKVHNSSISGGSTSTDTDKVLRIQREPILITGRYYGLVTFLSPSSTQHIAHYRVRHFNAQSGTFDGQDSTVVMPEVRPDRTGVLPFSNAEIDQSPLNGQGWYIFGAHNYAGQFVVRAIAPRRLWQLQPEQVITGRKAAQQYLHQRYWLNTGANKGRVNSVLVLPQVPVSETEAVPAWKEGDRYLLLHTFGGITGEQKEFSPLGIFFGHFAFGLAKVIREPLTQELEFRIAYRQVYTQNTQGLVAATLDWTNYMGDRQVGWLGRRPVVDIIVKLDILEDYYFGDLRVSPLSNLAQQLAIMTARYRTGDGTGGTFVGPANSCVQDSCQALYQAIQAINPVAKQWVAEHPNHSESVRYQKLLALAKDIERKLIPWGSAREDWRDPTRSLLGTRLADQPIPTVAKALTSFSSLLPRLANDALTEIFLNYGASFWVLRTNQVSGHNPKIKPLAPTKLWL